MDNNEVNNILLEALNAVVEKRYEDIMKDQKETAERIEKLDDLLR